MDYSTYDYNSVTPTEASSGFLAGMGMGLFLVYLAVVVFMMATLWKVYSKAGKPGWAAIVPIYNTIVQLQIVGRPLWWFFLLLIPFVNIVVGIIVINDLAKSFGKTVGWTVGLILLP